MWAPAGNSAACTFSHRQPQLWEAAYKRWSKESSPDPSKLSASDFPFEVWFFHPPIWCSPSQTGRSSDLRNGEFNFWILLFESCFAWWVCSATRDIRWNTYFWRFSGEWLNLTSNQEPTKSQAAESKAFIQEKAFPRLYSPSLGIF